MIIPMCKFNLHKDIGEKNNHCRVQPPLSPSLPKRYEFLLPYRTQEQSRDMKKNSVLDRVIPLEDQQIISQPRILLKRVHIE